VKNLTLLKEHIAAVCGLRFDDDNGTEKLKQSLQNRMSMNGLSDPTDYLKQITADQSEFQCLIELLTINETYFFRESEQIKLLTDYIVPRFLAHYEGRAKVRILSAGCSSGEEPYSLAIALWERYGESMPRLCSVNGVDIDNAVLARARTGIYREFSFRGVPSEIRERYFEKLAAGWQVKSDIRSLVSFQTLNLLARKMPEESQDYDIIFFRNVSIYFDEATRKQIQSNLASLMGKDGVLIVGLTETIANDLGVLTTVEENGQYYLVKGSPPLPKRSRLMDSPTCQKVATITKNSPQAQSDQPLPVLILPDTWNVEKSPPDIEHLSQLVHNKQYAQTLPMLERILTDAPDHKSALLLKAHILLNRKEFTLAQAAALQVLEQENWNVDAFLLLGLAAKWNQQLDEALTRFKQAVYACHTCWPAHYYLADIYRRSGAMELARREYRITLQQVELDTAETGIKVIPLELPLTQMRRLCEHQLSKSGNV